MERIGLQEAIQALRQELSASILAAAGQELRFEVGQITLELQVEVERSVEGSAQLKWWVLEIGGTGSRQTTQRHTITIPLTPLLPGGGPVLTGSSDIPE